jgi:hypothetical protein
MEKTMKSAESSVLYRKIDELELSTRDRAEAIAALEIADRLTNTIYWVFGKIGKLTGWPTLNPNPKFKHQ